MTPKEHYAAMKTRKRTKTGDVLIILFFIICIFVVFMSVFVKLTHVGNRSKLDNLIKLKKVTHNFCDNHKNRPLVLHKN